MFVHQERLEHRLRPEHYRAQEHYDKEIERLFLPTWRLAGCRADLPRDGDFRTLEICGYPILLRNFSGETPRSPASSKRGSSTVPSPA